MKRGVRSADPTNSVSGSLSTWVSCMALFAFGLAGLGYSVVAGGANRELSMLEGGSTVAETVELIERDGEKYPASPMPPERPSYYLENPPVQGGAERKCVDVTEYGASWSGEFIIGGALPDAIAGEATKFWWMPFEQIPGMSLQVRAVRLDSPTESLRFRSDVTAIPRPSRGDDLFFPWWIEFPEAGQWAVVGTSNGNWGCFVISVRDENGV